MSEPTIGSGGPPVIRASEERPRSPGRIKRGLMAYFTGFFLGCLILVAIMTIKQCAVAEQGNQTNGDTQPEEAPDGR